MVEMEHTFNRNLLLTISLISLILVVRLADAAASFDNWHGFVISTIHITIVAVGSYLAIKKR